MTLVCMFTLSIAACSSDDDSSSNSIVGKWVLDNSYYRFDSDGTGMYDSGGDTWGDFKYNTQSGTEGGSVYIRITYTNSKSQNVWRDEFSGSYNTKEGKLWINGKTYIKK